MSDEKDYSLLRPFDLEAAKRGDKICCSTGNDLWDYVAGPDSKGLLAVINKYNGEFLDPKNCPVSVFRMAPLCWVEGKPVYKGDVLYRPKINKGPVVADKIKEQPYGSSTSVYLYFQGAEGSHYADNRDGLMTWTPPKVKREVKLLAFIDDQGTLRWVREELFQDRGIRVPSEDKVIEIEDPASLEGGAK